MKRLFTPFSRLLAAATAALALAAGPAAAEPVEYAFDPDHTQIQLSWNHLGFSTFNARFADFSGTLMLDPETPANSSLRVTVPVESIDTGVDKLDQELLKEAYFHAEAHPEAVFESTRVEMTGEKSAKVHGRLTLKGKSNPLTLEVTLNKLGEHPLSGKTAAGFSATGTVQRSAYGIDKFVPMVSDEIALSISAEAQRAE